MTGKSAAAMRVRLLAAGILLAAACTAEENNGNFLELTVVDVTRAN